MDNKFLLVAKKYLTFDDQEHAALLLDLESVENYEEFVKAFEKHGWFISLHLVSQIKKDIEAKDAETLKNEIIKDKKIKSANKKAAATYKAKVKKQIEKKELTLNHSNSYDPYEDS